MKWDETIKLTDVAIVVAGLAKILAGQASFPMEVTKFPGDPAAQAAFKAVLQARPH